STTEGPAYMGWLPFEENNVMAGDGQSFDVGRSPVSITAAHPDQDADIPDLVTANAGDGTVSVINGISPSRFDQGGVLGYTVGNYRMSNKPVNLLFLMPGDVLVGKFDHDDGNLAVELFDTGMKRLAQADSADDNETISVNTLPEGTYLLKVTAPEGESDQYDLQFDLPLRGRTLGSDALEPNGAGPNSPVPEFADLGQITGKATFAGLGIRRPDVSDWTWTIESAEWTAGTHDFFAVVQDNHDDWSATSVGSVHVRNRPPVVDALGGAMARVIDGTGIQFRMLNRSRGPAVHSPRAQADRALYAQTMKHRLELQPNLWLRQANVNGLIIVGGRLRGVRDNMGLEYRGRTVVLTTGTFLNGIVHLGERQRAAGRAGEPPALGLSDHLRELGFEVGRLATCTPPRLHGRTVDVERLEAQYGDEPPRPFSFATQTIDRPNLPCYLTRTNSRTHAIIAAHQHRSAILSGQAVGAQPRYCPSVEDKVVRFPEKPSHQLFLEPEGEHTEEVYVNGLFTGLPADVQEAVVRSIDGCERAEIVRYGYAIEYDFVPPYQLRPSLEAQRLDGLFLAGQINGTSGYEEAAAQGLVAGINAVQRVRGAEPLVLGRDEAYIGVLVDDLVTLSPREPYRMFTSRAEYRLLLRQDNADRRLMPHARRLGLVDDVTWAALEARERAIAQALAYLEKTFHEGVSLLRILRRPGVSLADVEALDAELGSRGLSAAVREQVEIEAKYEGYIARQRADIERLRRLEQQPIPGDLDYEALVGLRGEAREKLARVRPASLAQAGRIAGVSPADVTALMVHLERRRP
ncbi:MAG: tRNA uridine-5-carboxymethylaminomethyl(34) synthesis enzyme MnmG, partial [Planctomycetota bacterium]